MGFEFSFLCDLLANLDSHRPVKPSTTACGDNSDIQIVSRWFAQHGCGIHDADTSISALLSCMFPEKRTDRVYGLQAALLSRVIGRSLGLGSSRLRELNQWQLPGMSDLGQCVENVMRQAENYIPAGQELLVEDVDRAMSLIASRCRFSGPQIRRNRAAADIESMLSSLYRRSSSRDAKWLTRMILKSYAPVVFPEQFTFRKFHFLLPHLLLLQNSFDGALEMLTSDPIKDLPPNPDPKAVKSLISIAMQHLRPRAGIKVARLEYYKARSIKHCHQMANGRRMSIERKYDGEYCQIHIDMSNQHAPVQIFSKSGKDSTADRSKVVPVVEEALQMQSHKCKFTQRCILEGELLVWNDEEKSIMDFNRLRRLLPRSGVLIGVDNDSPPQPFEHLMIMFFDILLLDEDVCLARPHRERRLILQKVVQTIPGRAELAHQEVLDFSRVDSYHRLKRSFEKAIIQRWEGYVLKASDEPYLPIYSTGTDHTSSRWIKLKKDYIPGLGDTVDLALIGASYDCRDMQSLSQIKRLKWTHFLVGCLLNKESVQEDNSLPHFRVLDVIGRHSMSVQNMQFLNQFGEFHARSPDEFQGFAVEYGHEGLSKATALFKRPFAVEMLGSGFEKPSNARYFTLRFPRILKIHSDRTIKDTASFRELQSLAETARAVPVEDQKECEELTKRLESVNESNQSVEMVSDPEATCSDTDSEPNSPAFHASLVSTASNDSHMDARPLMEIISNDTEKATRFNQSADYHSSAPLLHIDEPACSLETSTSLCGSSVLANNENIAIHRNSGQKHDNLTSDGCETPSATTWFQKPSRLAASGLTSPMRATGISSTENEGLRNLQKTEAKDSKTSFPLLKRKITPQSPLTTIPLWTPETSFGSFSFPDTDQDVDQNIKPPMLLEFLTKLGSNAAVSALQLSNPHAASQDMKYGIILFDPNVTALGKEMHKVVMTMPIAVNNGTCPEDSVGKIFFVASSILARDLSPSDPRFCLRKTWEQIGSEHYYGCISWDLRNRHIDSVTARARHPPTLKMSTSGLAETTDDHDSLSRSAPWIRITFDDSDIAVLGEYISIEPPIHVQDN